MKDDRFDELMDWSRDELADTIIGLETKIKLLTSKHKQQLAQQKALLDKKDDDIKFLKFKISEFLGLVADIYKCDKASADKINLWIDGNRAFLEKVKNESDI